MAGTAQAVEAMTKILLAYNGGAHSRRALATAAGLARRFRARVAVISVVPITWDRRGKGPSPWDDERVHRARLMEACQYLEASGIEAEIIEACGEPAAAIERTAVEGGYDTVVIGGGRAGTLRRLLSGSITLHVAEHVAATVIIAN